MILYFSGTGNSRYAAKKIAVVTGDEVVSINALIKNGNKETLYSDAPLVFVTPTYAYRMPRIVYDFIQRTPFKGNNKAYFVCTCGDSAGNAIGYAKKICSIKGFDFMGQTIVIMPENYVAMFKIPDKAESSDIIKKCEPQLLETAELIKKGLRLPVQKVLFGGRILSGFTNYMFYKLFVTAKGFHHNKACNGCGRCVKLCPLNNIQLTENEPIWGSDCTHCMACICGCPNAAIEYKNKTKGKLRYYLGE